MDDFWNEYKKNYFPINGDTKYRIFKKTKYSLSIDPYLFKSCDKINQPHVHRVNLCYRRRLLKPYSWEILAQVNYECGEVAEGIRTYEEFEKQDMAPIALEAML